MKLVTASLALTLMLAGAPAYADEPPSDDQKGGCSTGLYEVGGGLLAALVVMRRRSVTRGGADTKPSP